MKDTNSKIADDNFLNTQMVQALFDASTASILVINMQGLILECNSRCAQIFKMPVQKLKGRVVWDFMTGKVAAKRKMIMEKISRSGKLEEYEDERDDRRFFSRIYPLKDEKGIVTSVVINAVDVTESRNNEERLRRAEEQYRLITENMSDYIYSAEYNEHGYLQTEYVAGAFEKLTGYSIDQINDMGDGYFSIVEPEDLKILIKDARPRIRSGESIIVEYRIVHRNGSTRWFCDYIKPIIDKDSGIVTRVIGAVQDITLRKETEKALEESLEEKNILLRELYHRTRNNMQTICSMIGIRMSFIDDLPIRDMLMDFQNKIHTMALAQDKLYQSQNLFSINLADYIHDLAELFLKNYHVSSERIRLVEKLDNVSCSLNTAIPLGFVLSELFSNIFRHAIPDGMDGLIDLKLSNLNDEIELVLSDNGKGLPSGFDLKNSHTIGIQTIINLVNYQLSGKIEFMNYKGLMCRICFKDSE